MVQKEALSGMPGMSTPAAKHARLLLAEDLKPKPKGFEPSG